ncbi:glycosyltransferase [Modicisalibacter tunisiensis]|uniref:Glycosyltransferase n=1 Tax=Modicisalibacter tunisiensis TaxID=390637 RepID=A0ABS7WU21_9GAMM|nr:glycosyltransferase [Modicisalibacter tunisiensis]MBZ9540462.1 glycosyltransferase [Modicisalibacter tunisiensis]MBZ9566102.1 glycosyltransferase [Modicisalibacter tunisiensis]
MTLPRDAGRRVLIIVRRLNMGGIQKASLSLASGLLAGGHEVHLLVLKGTPELTVPDGVHLHCVDFERAARRTPAGLARHLASRVLLKPLLPGSGFVWTGRTVSRGFRHHLAELEATHGAFDLIVIRGQGAFELLWDVRDPRCWQVVEGPVSGPGKSPLAGWLYRKLYAGKRVISVSEGIGAMLDATLARHGVAPAQRRTLTNPVPLGRIRELAQAPLPDAPPTPYLIHVGRLSSVKNQALLLRAFAAADLPLSLVIIGDGDRRQSLTRLCETLGIAERVHFLGQQTNPYPWVARAQAFVLSSRMEGLGLVLIEALALGTQCVATDVPGGIREVLTGEQARLIAEPSVEGLAEKLREAWTHPVTVDPAWAERFDEPRVAEAFLGLLDDARLEDPADDDPAHAPA